jgi:ParB family chromosome partitioning protein
VARTSKPKGKKPTGERAPRRSSKAEAAAPGSRGLPADQLAGEPPPAAVTSLADRITADGGRVLGTYRDPVGGHWQILAGLPLQLVEPTPFQRDLSATHVRRMTDVIDRLDRFLDPVIAVSTDAGRYWTPNGNHRLTAMRELGAKSIVALVVPELEVCYKILALNTEKAHNLKEKALEVVRMARSLAELDDRPEREYALEFEEPALLTIGLCYEQRPRFSGGAYAPIVKRCEAFLDVPLAAAIELRRTRAARLLEIDDAVSEAVAALKARGFEDPYLRAFVVARVNPIRFKRGGEPAFDDTFATMLEAARAFDVGKVRQDQVAAAGGAAEED